ncbi:MAG: lipoprotein [Rickettsiales bacterium]
MKLKEIIAILGVCLALTSCGIKGSLELPEAEGQQMDAGY